MGRLLGISENCKNERCYKQLNVMLIKQSGAEYQHSIVDDILLMISQMFAFHILLEIFERKNRRKWNSCPVSSAADDDVVEPEVMEEKRRVEEYMKRKIR